MLNKTLDVILLLRMFSFLYAELTSLMLRSIFFPLACSPFLTFLIYFQKSLLLQEEGTALACLLFLCAMERKS